SDLYLTPRSLHLRVKLTGHIIVSGQYRGERKPIMGGPDRGIRHRRIITVYKIEIGILIDIVEQRMIRKRYAIPTHMRYLHSLSFRKSYHRNIKNVEAIHVAFLRVSTHQLKPQANAQKRPVKGPY